MSEAKTMEELRQGLEQLDLEDTLGDYDVDVEQIRGALELGSVDEAKAAIREVLSALQVISFGGFPVGDQIVLADLVGFD
jgi:hypothetical protein